MSKFIKVPAEQVPSLTGLYGSLPSMLEPFEYEVNGEMLWLLPYDVLADPEFAEVHDTLASFETIELAD